MIDNKLFAGEKLSPIKLLLYVLLTYTALIALRMRIEVGAGLETGSFIVDNLSKFSNQIYFMGLDDIILFAALFLLIRCVAAREQTVDLWTLALSLVFAALYVIALSCCNLGSLDFFSANLYQFCLSCLCILGFSVLFYFGLRLVFILVEQPAAKEEKKLRRPLLSAWLVIFLCWLPWLLMNYPGSFCTDSAYQLSQWLGLDAVSAHHPPFSTLLMGLCLSFGELVWDMNFGCFLYILFQSVSGAFIFSYTLMQLYRMGLSRRAWTLMLVFFASPFWACYAQWFEKDFIYAQLFALCLVLLLPVIKEGRCSAKAAAKLALVCLAAVLLRKTGLYELLPALLLIALWLKKQDRLRMLCAAAAVFVLCSCVNDVLYPAMGIESGSEREMLSLPFQQTANYVIHHPDEVTAEERAAIDNVLVYDELYKYHPEISDYIKNRYKENPEALPEYFRHWFAMLLKHPLPYFESAFTLSYGYLAPVKVSLDAVITRDYLPQLGEMGIYRVFTGSIFRVFDCLREIFIQFPLTSLMCMAGSYTWIMMACFVQLIRKKRFVPLLLFIPGIMNVLVCIASPLCASTRYALPLIASIPLIIGITLLNSKNDLT